MHRLLLIICAALSVIVTAMGAVNAQVAAPIAIYTDELKSGWADWSWGSAQDLANTTPVRGTRSIKVTQTPWSGLYFRTASPTSFVGSQSVTLWVHGGTVGGQTLQLHARDASGNPMSGVSLTPAPTANQWRQYTINLSALGVTTQQITGFVVQNFSATNAPTYYVDDVSIRPVVLRQMLYADAAANGWTLGTGFGATINAANTTPVRSGTRSISVIPSADWAHIGIDKTGASLAGYEKLEFWGHGGTVGGQQLDVQAFRNGSLVGSYYLPALAAGQWKRRTVPLTSLNPSGGLVDSILIFYPSGSTGARFYLDDIALIRKQGPSDSVLMTGLNVSGNKLRNGSNQTLFVHGANYFQTAFACVQGYDFQPRTQEYIDAIKAWNINAVRVPINEQCWLNINTVPANATYIAKYKADVIKLVNDLTEHNLAVILDLHYGMPGTLSTIGLDLQPMPNADHSSAFWTSVANTFKSNSSVIFDLYNEPYVNTGTEAQKWTCWKNGGASCSVQIADNFVYTGTAYAAVGMQSLVNTVRATGATNVIMVGGLNLAGNLQYWLTYKPTDSANNLMASWHQYNFAICADSACWNSQVAPVMAAVPVIVGEFGMGQIGPCDTAYLDQLMAFVESKKQGYMAWTFMSDAGYPTGGNCGAPDFEFYLIDKHDGTVSNYGLQYYNRLRNQAGTYP